MTHDHEHQGGWRFHPERRHVLNDEERRRTLPAGPALAALAPRPGEQVLDLGAGVGYFTAPLARAVGPQGRVYAVDIEPIMLSDLGELRDRENLPQIEVVAAEEAHIPLPDGCADAALAAFVLHEPPDAALWLAEVRRLLRPEARLLILDWHKRPTEKGPPQGHRISPEEGAALLEQANFQVETVPATHTDVWALLARLNS